MDDLIRAGILAVTGIYAAAILFVAAVILTLVELYGAVASGDNGRVAAILVILFFLSAAYSGTGVWLQKTGRI